MSTKDRVQMIEIKECEFSRTKSQSPFVEYSSDFSCRNANKNFLKLKIPINQSNHMHLWVCECV